MAFWNKWPYTNLQNLNLDWILNEIKKLKEEGVTLQSVRTALNDLIGSNSNTAKNADKLGDKAPEYYLHTINLLDNSDFRHPINQRGATLYTGNGNNPVYSIDRWYTWGVGATLTVNSASVTIAGSPFLQNVPLNRFTAGKTYTLVCRLKDGTLRVATAQYGSDAGGAAYKIYLEWVGRNGVGYRAYMYPDELEWAALYEGRYTANTLPPYVPLPYIVELAECKRYYRRIKNAIILVSPNNQSYYRASSIYYEEMRIDPSITLLANESAQFGLCHNVAYITDVNDISITNRANGCLGLATQKENFAGRTIQIYDIELSADL